MADKIRRFDSRTLPFSRGGGGDRTAGALIPEGPDPLYLVSSSAPDIHKLPWERRTYDAWTTPEFRALVLAWLADMFVGNPWMYRWRIRERSTQQRLSLARLVRPVLLLRITRRSDGQVFEVSSEWTAAERDDAAQVNAKLAQMRNAIELLHGAMP